MPGMLAVGVWLVDGVDEGVRGEGPPRPTLRFRKDIACLSDRWSENLTISPTVWI